MSQGQIDLSDKTAIITGGGSGIGAGIARTFGALGANLVIADFEMETTVIPELQAAHMKQVPFGRFGQPEDVARVAAFVASSWAEWITGASIPVDGGMHLVGEESYLWAIERVMGHHEQIPKVPMCWPPGALEEESEEET